MQLIKFFSPIIDRFSRSGLKSSHPKKRIQAILEELEPGSPELENIAINDEDLDVKICAINRLTSLDIIQNIIMKCRDEKTKKIIFSHLSKIICGETFPTPDLQEREEALISHLPNKNIEYISLNAKEQELRIIAIKKLNRDALLGDIALNDKVSLVKTTAAQQLTKKSTLERVCKKSRSKDKKVYKICKEKLQVLIDDEERPKRISHEIVELCDQLEKIFKRNLLIQEESTINNYRKKWPEYLNFANEETQLRYHEIINKIDTALGGLKQQQENEQEVRISLQQIMHNLSIEAEELLSAKEKGANEKSAKELIDTKLQAIEAYKTEWAKKIQDITSKKHSDIIKQYNSILVLIEQTEDSQESLSSMDLLNQYASQAEQLLSHSQYISEKLINSLENNFSLEYHKILKSSPQSSTLAQESKAFFKQKLKQLHQKIEAQQEDYNTLIQSSEKLLKEINTSLKEGLTDEAQHLKKKYHHLIDQCKVISSKDKELMLEKIRSSDKQLSKLASWKNWANNRERENLCHQAESLLEKIQQSEDSIAQKYNNFGDQVKVFRSEWKKLKGRSDDKLWEQFNTACNSCFEVFKPHFEQQSELRGNNLHLKEAICKQLDNYIQYMKWPSKADKTYHKEIDKGKTSEDLNNPEGSQSDKLEGSYSKKPDESRDWIQVNKILRQAKDEWRKIGPVEKQPHKKISKQFNKHVDIINHELKQAWAVNQKKYQHLIDQVFALHKDIDKDLGTAINGAKSLQSQWKTIGPVQHFQRKELWKNFRKGCDIIFNKREEIKLEENQANEALLMEKIGLCENLQALNQQDLSIEDLNEAYKQIESTWSIINNEHPTKRRAVDQQFETAQKEFHNNINALKAQHKQLLIQQQADLITNKSNICSELENKKQSSDETQVYELWKGLDKLKKSKFDKAMETRFIQAQQIANTSIAEKNLADLIEKTYKEKEQLCLKLEVLTGKQSPDDKAQNRLEFQIEQMNSKNDALESTIDELVEQWTVLANFEEHEGLNKRFNDIVG